MINSSGGNEDTGDESHCKAHQLKDFTDRVIEASTHSCLNSCETKERHNQR
jgi:hypothetical protein